MLRKKGFFCDDINKRQFNVYASVDRENILFIQNIFSNFENDTDVLDLLLCV